MIRYLIAMLLLLCSACIQIGSDPEPVRYYLLESLQETADVYSGSTLNIKIKLADLPEYLDRLQIVTRSSNNDLDFSGSDRWAEPLQTNIARVLQENLALMLPDATISVSPWAYAENGKIKVNLEVVRFSGQRGEHTQIDIRWTIADSAGPLRRGLFSDRQPIGNSYHDLVVGLNDGIHQLSRNLAKELATLPSS